MKFSSRLAYDRLAAHIFSICLASLRPLTLDEVYDALNCAYLTNNNEKLTSNDLLDQINNLDGFLISLRYYDVKLDSCSSDLVIRTPLYTFAHSAIRDWWLVSGHNTSGSLAKPVYNPNWGSFLLSSRLLRSPELNRRLTHSLSSNSFKFTVSVYLDLMSHLVRSSDLWLAQPPQPNRLDMIAYLLSLYLPNNSILKRQKMQLNQMESSNSKLAVEQFYTNLMISAEFLCSNITNANMFRVLIKLGANLTAQVPHFNHMPFMCVLARLGHTSFLRVLTDEFEVRFEADCVDKQRSNMLSLATQQGHLECAKFILEHSTSQVRMLTQLDSSGLCGLIHAVTSPAHSVELLDYYVKRLGPPEANGKLIQQALVWSASSGNRACLNYLVENCLKSRYKELVSIEGIEQLRGDTALTAASTSGQRAVCEYLIETARASMNTANARSWTPLLCAVRAGQWEIVEYLLSKNSLIINQTDKHGRDSLILAASEGHLAIMDILIEKGVNLGAQDRDGLSALSWACLKGLNNSSF